MHLLIILYWEVSQVILGLYCTLVIFEIINQCIVKSNIKPFSGGGGGPT